ncbi:MAG: PucR family transcriptional regulator [Microbacteriaceae bacterium]
MDDEAAPSGQGKEQTLSWLRAISGELASATLQGLDATLPWYRDMPPGRRSAVGLVAQAGITSFIQYYEDPSSQPWVAADVFGAAPRELLGSVSLQQTLQLIRVTVATVEARIAGHSDDLRDTVLLYSREIAFAAADLYARAAEARGLWDARLEALVVDSILSGEYDDELPSRIAALGWQGRGEVAVLVGTVPRLIDVDQIRRAARRMHADVLIGVQGSRLVVVIGRALPEPNPEPDQKTPGTGPDTGFQAIAARLAPLFGDGDLVLGHSVPSVVGAVMSAKAALSGFAVARSWRNVPRPVLADDLLPERAFAGDPIARKRLVTKIYQPLKEHSPELLTTLWCYLDNGRSLEATARELFVHPNTVRYRLKRVSELLGWDATGPREALILQAALIVGAISDNEPIKRP